MTLTSEETSGMGRSCLSEHVIGRRERFRQAFEGTFRVEDLWLVPVSVQRALMSVSRTCQRKGMERRGPPPRSGDLSLTHATSWSMTEEFRNLSIRAFFPCMLA